MALIRLSSLIGSISGSLGPITFKNTRFGPLATKRLLRTKQRSPAQQSSDSRWVTITRAWQELSVEQRLAWKRVANEIPFTNSLGVTYRRSAFSLFTRHSTPAYHAGLPLNTYPPFFKALPELTTVYATFDVITGYRINYVISGFLSPVYLLTYGARPLSVPKIDYRSPGKFPPPYIFKNWRFLRINTHALGGSGETLTTFFKEALGTCAPREAVAVRAFLWHPYALQSPESFVSTFVTD